MSLLRKSPQPLERPAHVDRLGEVYTFKRVKNRRVYRATLQEATDRYRMTPRGGGGVKLVTRKAVEDGEYVEYQTCGKCRRLHPKRKPVPERCRG